MAIRFLGDIKRAQRYIPVARMMLQHIHQNISLSTGATTWADHKRMKDGTTIRALEDMGAQWAVINSPYIVSTAARVISYKRYLYLSPISMDDDLNGYFTAPCTFKFRKPNWIPVTPPNRDSLNILDTTKLALEMRGTSALLVNPFVHTIMDYGAYYWQDTITRYGYLNTTTWVSGTWCTGRRANTSWSRVGVIDTYGGYTYTLSGEASATYSDSGAPTSVAAKGSPYPTGPMTRYRVFAALNASPDDTAPMAVHEKRSTVTNTFSQSPVFCVPSGGNCIERWYTVLNRYGIVEFYFGDILLDSGVWDESSYETYGTLIHCATPPCPDTVEEAQAWLDSTRDQGPHDSSIFYLVTYDHEWSVSECNNTFAVVYTKTEWFDGVSDGVHWYYAYRIDGGSVTIVEIDIPADSRIWGASCKVTTDAIIIGWKEQLEIGVFQYEDTRYVCHTITRTKQTDDADSPFDVSKGTKYISSWDVIAGGAPALTVTTTAGGTLTPGDSYYYAVSACNPISLPPISIPQEVEMPIEEVGYVANLSWNAVSGATHYLVFRGTTATVRLIAVTTQTSYIDDGTIAATGTGTPNSQKLTQPTNTVCGMSKKV